MSKNSTKGNSFINGLSEIYLELEDTSWPFTYTDHDRMIVRGVVYDDEGNFYFVRADRDDDFGRAVTIETAGGGVEKDENLEEAIRRELLEELGAEVDVICKIGVVSDYYNLIHRHNINNYYLCKVRSFSERMLTEDEMNKFHLSTLKLNFDEAVEEYKRCSTSRLGNLLYNREMPILLEAKRVIEREKNNDN